MCNPFLRLSAYGGALLVIAACWTPLASAQSQDAAVAAKVTPVAAFARNYGGNYGGGYGYGYRSPRIWQPGYPNGGYGYYPYGGYGYSSYGYPYGGYSYYGGYPGWSGYGYYDPYGSYYTHYAF